MVKQNNIMNIALYIIIAIAFCGIGILLATTKMREKLLKKSQDLIKEAEDKAEIIKKEKILQAKEKFLQMKADNEKECRERTNKVIQNEQKLRQKEQAFNKEVEELKRKNAEVNNAKETLKRQADKLAERQQEVEKTYQESLVKLEQIAGLSAEEAKSQLIETLTEEARSDAMGKIMEIVEEAKMTANQQAKKIGIEAIQRTAAETAIGNTGSVVNV